MGEGYRGRRSLRHNGRLDREGPGIMQQLITSMFRTAARPYAHLLTLILEAIIIYRTIVDYSRVSGGDCTLVYALQPTTC